jgi:hypothetical protein
MKTYPLWRAALLASVLALATACPSTDPGEGDGGTTTDGGTADGGSTGQPTPDDTDGDKVPDAVEDANGNGRVDTGETNPKSKDSDCDGLPDGVTLDGVRGEDLDVDGVVDSGETDPRNRDSDGDGLTDGVELGARVNVAGSACPAVTFDADATTTTDPLDADSDNDGIRDGAEDANQDGKKDPGELDPKNGTDGSGPAGQACAEDRLRPVVLRTEGPPDLQVALPAAPRFAQTTTLTTSSGERVGLMGWDAESKVAFFVYRQAAPSTDPSKDETALFAKLNSPNALTNPTRQTLTTWDGYPALRAQYDQANASGIKARANALATALLPAGATGFLPPAGDVASGGPFRVQAQFIHRSNQSLVVLVAVTPLSSVAAAGTPLFTVNDLTGTTAVAQFVDTTAVQCETFQTGQAKVDFLFVVDDSGSMASSQGALGASAEAIATALTNSSLDWRISLVTSTYHVDDANPNELNFDLLRPFTADISTFRGWLTNNAACTSTSANNGEQCLAGAACYGSSTGWVGVCGTGAEGILGAARKAVDVVTSAASSAPLRARPDAKVVVILLGDADDQTTKDAVLGASGVITEQGTTRANCGAGGSSTVAGSECVPVSSYNDYFTARDVPVHGILCPAGSTCSEFNPQPTPAPDAPLDNRRHAAVVRRTGGIEGSILDAASIRTAINAIVQDAIGSAGYRLTKAPIGPSIKVSLAAVQTPGSCTASDIPRSRTNGFDFDGEALSFYGACRAPQAGTPAAVSYRYWVDGNSSPDGRPPCDGDPKFDPAEADFCSGNFACEANACVCKEPAAGCAPGFSFKTDPAICACTPIIG